MTLNIPALTEAWQRVDALAHAAVAPIESEAQLLEATATLRLILHEIGEKPGHPLDSLARSLIERITAFEAEHYPIPDIYGAELLGSLMRERDLTQQEVARGTGISQSTISQLLNGKREFTTEHIRALSAFFGVKQALFLPDGVKPASPRKFHPMSGSG